MNFREELRVFMAEHRRMNTLLSQRHPIRASDGTTVHVAIDDTVRFSVNSPEVAKIKPGKEIVARVSGFSFDRRDDIAIAHLSSESGLHKVAKSMLPKMAWDVIPHMFPTYTRGFDVPVEAFKNITIEEFNPDVAINAIKRL